MNRFRLAPYATALLASTAAPIEAIPQVLIPTGRPDTAPIVPTGQAPVVDKVDRSATGGSGVTNALIQQADTQRRLGHKDLAAQALQRALRDSPNNANVYQRLAQYAVADGDFGAAASWTQKLRAVAPRDPRAITLESQIKAAETPVTTAPPEQAQAPIQMQPPPPMPAAGPPPPPPPSPKPQAAPQPTPVAQPRLSRREQRRQARERRRQQQVAAAPRPAPPPAPEPKPTQTAEAAPAPAPPPKAPQPQVDTSAEARTAGFLALNGGDLPGAERQFNAALRLRPGDLDAAGGLGVIRLQQQRFSDARDLLARAVRGPQGNERWGQALQTAEFFFGLDKARADYNAGRYGDAEQEARRLADAGGPNRVEAQILLGQSLQQEGQAAAAEQAYRQALTAAPGRVDAASGLAIALANLGRFDEASRVLDGLPPGQIAAARSTVERGRAADLQRRGDNFGATASLASALRATPSDPWVRFDYAHMLLVQGQAAQSQAIATPLYTASDSESLQAAALYSESRGRSAEAAAILRRIPPNARNAAVRDLASRVEGQQYIDQAKQLGAVGQNVQAVTLLRDYLNRGNPSFEMRSSIADTLFDLGDTYEAGALALDAARQQPATFSPDSAGGFLSVLAQTGQDTAAISLLSAAARQAQASSANQKAYRTLVAGYASRRADRLRTAGNYADAFDTLSQAFALSPRDPVLLGALARLYQSGNLPQQAQQAYDALLAMTPNDYSSITGAAQAAQAQGDYPRAEKLLRRAASLRPGDPELYYQIGQLEQSRGHDRDALKAFEHADALLKNGRAQGLLAPGFARPTGGGVLGPNPFTRTLPTNPEASPYGAIDNGTALAQAAPATMAPMGAGYIPLDVQAMTPPSYPPAAPPEPTYPVAAGYPAQAAYTPAAGYTPAQAAPPQYVPQQQAYPQDGAYAPARATPADQGPAAYAPGPSYAPAQGAAAPYAPSASTPQQAYSPAPAYTSTTNYAPAPTAYVPAQGYAQAPAYGQPQTYAQPQTDARGQGYVQSPAYVPAQPAYPPASAASYIPVPAGPAPPIPGPAYGAGYIPMAAQAAAQTVYAPPPGYQDPSNYQQPFSPQPAAPFMIPGAYVQAQVGPAQYVPNNDYGSPYAAAIPSNSAPGAPTPAFAAPQTYAQPTPAYGPLPLAYPQQAVPTQAQTQAGYGAYAGYGAGQPNYGGDPNAPFALPAPEGAPPPPEPLPTRLNRQITDLRDNTAAQVTASISLRNRSGEDGTSKLFDALTTADISFSPFDVGRLGLRVMPEILTAGTPPADAAATLGQVPLADAVATAAAKTLNFTGVQSRHASGVAFTVYYDTDPLSIDFGTTPIGFEEKNISAGVTARIPLGGGSQLRGSIETRPVTDSILSYAGMNDPQTDIKMGSVQKQSGSFGGSITFGSRGQGGAYADGTYKILYGNNVAPNTGYEGNAGVYYRPIDSDGKRLQIGVNVNMQSYAKNLRFFSFGQGGYFSPQEFLSLALPVSYSITRPRWNWNVGLTLGLQSYSEDSSPVFPTLPYAEAALIAYSVGFPTVASRYIGQSRTGLGVAATTSGEYKLSPTTAFGGDMSIDTFGIYNEYKVRIYLKRILSGLD
jgi:tetratricopeptide (TPR) repeat protein